MARKIAKEWLAIRSGQNENVIVLPDPARGKGGV